MESYYLKYAFENCASWEELIEGCDKLKREFEALKRNNSLLEPVNDGYLLYQSNE